MAGNIENISFSLPIPYGRQEITETDIEAVVSVLKSDFLTQGPAIQKFEEEFAKYVGAKFAVAVANGTAALHLAAIALNVKPGQKVITTPITFAASANCIRYCGGEVYFADIDPKSYLIDIESLKKLVDKCPKGTFSGIVPVDFAGYPVNLEQLKNFADEHGLWIMEDACHAPGGYFTDSKGKQQLCGNGKYADISIFSFHPVKHIATGEGGMITTNNKYLYERLLILRTHGITKKTDWLRNNPSLADGSELNPDIETDSSFMTFPGWYYEMIELGYNYRMTDVLAALGSSQLKRADENFKKRQLIAEKYNEKLNNLDIQLPEIVSTVQHAFHLYVIQTNKRLALYNYLRENKIFAQVLYVPVHLHPYYQDLGYKAGDFPEAEKYYSRCLSLPMYPSLKAEQQDYIIKVINDFFQK
jgi:UDP-4-amino-4,6-dideoxy-N-acetyl-beta-L-altrosamine transaminase